MTWDSLESLVEENETVDLFESFCHAETFAEIVDIYTRLCSILELQPGQALSFYRKLRGRLNFWQAKQLWTKLDKRASQSVYQNGLACSGLRVFIIGAGPCGLRTAIECVLLGARVVIVEKRDKFSRNNVLHLWPYLIKDLQDLGAKKFFPKFCAGQIDHISIRRLQCMLLKVALILGVELHSGVTYDSLRPPNELKENQDRGWTAVLSPSDHPLNTFEFDVIVGADGKKNTLEGFRRKEFRGKLAIAITANFINFHTRAERDVPEISGVAFIFNQEFFKKMRDECGIDLENIVYYQDDTHYFVMTAKKQSLLQKGVLLQDFNDVQYLLHPDNINKTALLEYGREAADFSTNHKLPKLQYAFNNSGLEDVAMFDFTSRFQAEFSSHVIERSGYKLLLALVGDSLLEPFWPMGTGCARGFFGAFDAAWMMLRWCSGQFTPLEIIAERETIFQLLSQTTVDNTCKDFNAYTIDPSTRYANLNIKRLLPHQVRQAYDSDIPPKERDNDACVGRLPLTRYSEYDLQMEADSLLGWCQRKMTKYKNICTVTDLSSSWRDGIALCCLVAACQADPIDVTGLSPDNAHNNIMRAFDLAKTQFGFESGDLTPDTMMKLTESQRLVLAAYLRQFYNKFRRQRGLTVKGPNEEPKSRRISRARRKSGGTVGKTRTSRSSAMGGHRQSTGPRARQLRVSQHQTTEPKQSSSGTDYEPPRKQRSSVMPERLRERVERLLTERMLGTNNAFRNQPGEHETPESFDGLLDNWREDQCSNSSGFRTCRSPEWDIEEGTMRLRQQELLEAIYNPPTTPTPKPVLAELPPQGMAKKKIVDLLNVASAEPTKEESKPEKFVLIEKAAKDSIQTIEQTKDLKSPAKQRYQQLDDKLKTSAKLLEKGNLGQLGEVGEKGSNRITALAERLQNAQSEPSPFHKRMSDRPTIVGNTGFGDFCFFCKRRLQPYDQTDSDGLNFHLRCWKCAQCGTALNQQTCCFVRSEARYYCSEHVPMETVSSNRNSLRTPDLPKSASVSPSSGLSDAAKSARQRRIVDTTYLTPRDTRCAILADKSPRTSEGGTIQRMEFQLSSPENFSERQQLEHNLRATLTRDDCHKLLQAVDLEAVTSTESDEENTESDDEYGTCSSLEESDDAVLESDEEADDESTEESADDVVMNSNEDETNRKDTFSRKVDAPLDNNEDTKEEPVDKKAPLEGPKKKDASAVGKPSLKPYTKSQSLDTATFTKPIKPRASPERTAFIKVSPYRKSAQAGRASFFSQPSEPVRIDPVKLFGDDVKPNTKPDEPITETVDGQADCADNAPDTKPDEPTTETVDSQADCADNALDSQGLIIEPPEGFQSSDGPSQQQTHRSVSIETEMVSDKSLYKRSVSVPLSPLDFVGVDYIDDTLNPADLRNSKTASKPAVLKTDSTSQLKGISPPELCRTSANSDAELRDQADDLEVPLAKFDELTDVDTLPQQPPKLPPLCINTDTSSNNSANQQQFTPSRRRPSRERNSPGFASMPSPFGSLASSVNSAQASPRFSPLVLSQPTPGEEAFISKNSALPPPSTETNDLYDLAVPLAHDDEDDEETFVSAESKLNDTRLSNSTTTSLYVSPMTSPKESAKVPQQSAVSRKLVSPVQIESTPLQAKTSVTSPDSAFNNDDRTKITPRPLSSTDESSSSRPGTAEVLAVDVNESAESHKKAIPLSTSLELEQAEKQNDGSPQLISSDNLKQFYEQKQERARRRAMIRAQSKDTSLRVKTFDTVEPTADNTDAQLPAQRVADVPVKPDLLEKVLLEKQPQAETVDLLAELSSPQTSEIKTPVKRRIDVKKAKSAEQRYSMDDTLMHSTETDPASTVMTELQRARLFSDGAIDVNNADLAVCNSEPSQASICSILSPGMQQPTESSQAARKYSPMKRKLLRLFKPKGAKHLRKDLYSAGVNGKHTRGESDSVVLADPGLVQLRDRDGKIPADVRMRKVFSMGDISLADGLNDETQQPPKGRKGRRSLLPFLNFISRSKDKNASITNDTAAADSDFVASSTFYAVALSPTTCSSEIPKSPSCDDAVFKKPVIVVDKTPTKDSVSSRRTPRRTRREHADVASAGASSNTDEHVSSLSKLKVSDEHLHSDNSDLERKERSSGKHRRTKREQRKRQKQQELKRLHMAQELQRQLDEVDVRRLEIEQRSAELESQINNDHQSPSDSKELTADWLSLINEKNLLCRYENELILHRRELELEDRQARLETLYRDIATKSDASADDEDREKDILAKMVAVVNERDNVVKLIEELQSRQKEEDKNFFETMQKKGVHISPIAFSRDLYGKKSAQAS